MAAYSWKLTGETMGLAALVAGDSAAFLSGVNPSHFTIRTFRSDWARPEQTAKEIHIGMAIGNALSLMVGIGATMVSGSWWPFALSLITSVALDASYEWALRSNRGTIDG